MASLLLPLLQLHPAIILSLILGTVRPIWYERVSHSLSTLGFQCRAWQSIVSLLSFVLGTFDILPKSIDST
jgi:hypothetical protein